MSCRIHVIALAAATAASLAGCSLTLEFEQCRNDADCRNDEGLDLVCASNTCQPRTKPEDVTCVSTVDCVEVLGADHVCTPANICLDLLGAHCSEVWRPAAASLDQITYLPVVLPPGAARNATRMAVQAFAEQASGQSPIGWLGCDQPAIGPILGGGFSTLVGGRTTDDTASLLALTNPAGALLITPSARGLSLGNTPLLWRTVAGDDQEARAMAARLAALDPPPTQVLTLAPNDLTGRAFREAFSRELLAHLPQVNEAVLLYTPADAFGSAQDRSAAYAAVADQGLPHEANAVVLLGTHEASELALHYLARRDQLDPRPPLPRFVFARDAVPFMPAVLEGVSASFRATLATALEGVTPRYSTPERYAEYAKRYSARFGVEGPPTNSAPAYDATALALLGIAASGRLRPLGSETSSKIASLITPGAPVVDLAFDPDALATGLQHLRRGDPIDLEGMTGPLEFDLGSQTLTSDFVGWDVQTVDGSTFFLREARVFDGTWSNL